MIVGELLARRLPGATPERSSLVRCGGPAVPRRAGAAGTGGHGPRRVRERGRGSRKPASATGKQNHHAGADRSRERETVAASRGGARCRTPCQPCVTTCLLLLELDAGEGGCARGEPLSAPCLTRDRWQRWLCSGQRLTGKRAASGLGKFPVIVAAEKFALLGDLLRPVPEDGHRRIGAQIHG
jgi:hypothetical protein